MHGTRFFIALLCSLLLLALPAAQAGGAPGDGRSEARALRLARALPDAAGRLEALREPARTAQAQAGTALDQLRQMSALTYDPHYLPALVAAGRAFVAVSGRDPLTGTVIDPEYTGLDEELAGNAYGLRRSGAEGAELAGEVKRLGRRLRSAERRSRDLEARLRRLRR